MQGSCCADAGLTDLVKPLEFRYEFGSLQGLVSVSQGQGARGRMSGLGGCIVGAKHGRQNLGRSPREYLRPCFARTQNGGFVSQPTWRLALADRRRITPTVDPPLGIRGECSWVFAIGVTAPTTPNGP